MTQKTVDRGKEKKRAFSLPGTTSSIFNGARLKGSLGSLRRWERIVDRSMDILDVGRMTGSFMMAYIKGSAQVNCRLVGMSASN